MPSPLELEIERSMELEKALQTAVDDLYKASNQFHGLLPNGQNWKRFEEKAKRAEKVLKE